jgi:hypothetical protein
MTARRCMQYPASWRSCPTRLLDSRNRCGTMLLASQKQYAYIIQEIRNAFAPLTCAFDRYTEGVELRFTVKDALDEETLSAPIIVRLSDLRDLRDEIEAERSRLIAHWHLLPPWTPPSHWE